MWISSDTIVTTDRKHNMTKTEAQQLLTAPCDAAILLKIAVVLGVKGTLEKKFRNGQELRHYALSNGWQHTKIRAMPSEHNI